MELKMNRELKLEEWTSKVKKIVIEISMPGVDETDDLDFLEELSCQNFLKIAQSIFY